MPTESSISAVLSKERAHTEAPFLAELGRDMYRRSNGNYEMLTGRGSPGSTGPTVPAQRHDGIVGCGILRAKIGDFRGPISKTTNSITEVSMGDGESSYPANATYTSNKEIGVAVVSPGISSIRIEMLFWADTTAYGAKVAVKELLTGNTSNWIDLPSIPFWMGSVGIALTMTLTVPATTGGSTVVPLDILVKCPSSGGVNNTTIHVYRAFVYEYQDQP